MCITEYDEKLHLENLYKEGLEDGIEQGAIRERHKNIKNMISNGFTDEVIRSVLECTQEEINSARAGCFDMSDAEYYFL